MNKHTLTQPTVNTEQYHIPVAIDEIQNKSIIKYEITFVYSEINWRIFLR